jgi:hypothetical protein
MTIFDQFGFEQRSYVIQQLETLAANLKEANFCEELINRGLIVSIGQPSTGEIEQKILEFALNHFGQPYSSETREDEIPF